MQDRICKNMIRCCARIGLETLVKIYYDRNKNDVEDNEIGNQGIVEDIEDQK